MQGFEGMDGELLNTVAGQLVPAGSMFAFLAAHRAEVFPDAGAPYGMTQASYDLARLARNGLITRRPHANTYDLTPDGLKFAIFYTKVHDRVLSPLFTAGQPQAPPPLHAALRTIEQQIDYSIAAARLPSAA